MDWLPTKAHSSALCQVYQTSGHALLFIKALFKSRVCPRGLSYNIQLLEAFQRSLLNGGFMHNPYTLRANFTLNPSSPGLDSELYFQTHIGLIEMVFFSARLQN